MLRITLIALAIILASLQAPAFANSEMTVFYTDKNNKAKIDLRVDLICTDKEGIKLPDQQTPCKYYLFVQREVIAGKIVSEESLGSQFPASKKENVAKVFKDEVKNHVKSRNVDYIFKATKFSAQSFFPNPVVLISVPVGIVVDLFRLPYSVGSSISRGIQGRKISRRLEKWSKGEKLESTKVGHKNFSTFHNSVVEATKYQCTFCF